MSSTLATMTGIPEGKYEDRHDATFPIGDVVESVFSELKIPFTVRPFNGGFDSRVCRHYLALLPLDKKPLLHYALGVISERYFSRYEPEVTKNRPDLILNGIQDDGAYWFPSVPEGQGNSYAFMDICRITLAAPECARLPDSFTTMSRQRKFLRGIFGKKA